MATMKIKKNKSITCYSFLLSFPIQFAFNAITIIMPESKNPIRPQAWATRKPNEGWVQEKMSPKNIAEAKNKNMYGGMAASPLNKLVQWNRK